jgi:hypothetical protein
MKSALIAAAALVGSAQAGVHKMKLQKVPLAEQLVRHPPSLSIALFAVVFSASGLTFFT